VTIWTLARRVAVPTPRSGTLDAVLLDADGATLAHVGAVIPSGGGLVELPEVAEPDRLLRFYFGNGGRQLLLALEDAVVEGRLATRWETTGRHWWLELD
jgi:hypothetical protein